MIAATTRTDQHLSPFGPSNGSPLTLSRCFCVRLGIVVAGKEGHIKRPEHARPCNGAHDPGADEAASRDGSMAKTGQPTTGENSRCTLTER
jgi:hypothetical protein